LQVEVAAKNKSRTSYDTVAQLLSRTPHPVKAPGLEELQESAAAAAAWRTKYYTAIGLPAAAAAAAAGVSIAAVAAADGTLAAERSNAAAAVAAAAAAERKAAAEAEAAAAAAAAAAARRVNTRAAATAAVAAAFSGCTGTPVAPSTGSDEALAARVAEPPSAALAAAAAAAAAAFAGKHFDVQALSELADEVLDIGLELPEQQLLRQRLEEGVTLQEQISEVLSAEGDDRYDVHGLRDLQHQASTCGLALEGKEG
jgi:SWI/SNF-related matrix-associated actin-dependent regulator 1 of chromatin subfamily A